MILAMEFDAHQPALSSVCVFCCNHEKINCLACHGRVQYTTAHNFWCLETVCADECVCEWVRKSFISIRLRLKGTHERSWFYEWADFLEVNNFMDLRNHFSFSLHQIYFYSLRGWGWKDVIILLYMRIWCTIELTSPRQFLHHIFFSFIWYLKWWRDGW